MAINSFYMGFDANLRIKGSVNLGTALNPDIVENYDGPVVFGKQFNYKGKGGGWIGFPHNEYDNGGYWIARNPWLIACFGPTYGQRHYTRFCRLELDDSEPQTKTVAQVSLIEEVNLMDYVSSIPWETHSWAIARWFPDLVDIDKYNWFAHSMDIVVHAKAKFDPDKFGWMLQGWVIPIYGKELFDPLRFHWILYSPQIAAFAPEFLNEGTASLFNWEDPLAIRAVERFCPEKMALKPNQ